MFGDPSTTSPPEQLALMERSLAGVAAAFAARGFEVDLVPTEDLTASVVRERFAEYERTLTSADTFVLYTHGHGGPFGTFFAGWVQYAERILALPARNVIVLSMSCEAGRLTDRLLARKAKWEDRAASGRSLVVLTPVDASQNAGPSPEPGIGNPFTHAVITAVQGSADGCSGRERNGRVELQELVDHVLAVTRSKSRDQSYRPQFAGVFPAEATFVTVTQEAAAPPRSTPEATAPGLAPTDLRFEIRGDGAPVVLLSGGPGFGNYLQPVADALAGGNRCILFEQRGTGASPEKLDADSLTLANAIADLEALRVHLKLERWSLLGHSWGGMLAMAYATKHADRLDCLVLLGTGGPTLEFFGPFGDTLAGRATPEERATLAKWNEPAAIANDPDRAMQEQLRIRFPAYFYDREKAAAAWPAFAKVSYTPATHRALIADLQRLKFNLRSGLAEAHCRTLVIHGRQDPIPASVVYEIREVMPQLELRFLEKCGHFPWIEQPEDTFRVLRAFLAKH